MKVDLATFSFQVPTIGLAGRAACAPDNASATNDPNSPKRKRIAPLPT
jgi:hypothetical protein